MPKTARTSSLFVALAAVALTASFGLGLHAAGAISPVLAEGHDVKIVDYEFQPSTLTVFVGDPITWTNDAGRDHTVTSDQGTELDSGAIHAGEAYGHVFETPGTYAYHCDIHPDTMQGTVVVKAAPATPAPSGEPTASPPSGTLPPDFSPFPSTGPVDSPTPQATAAPSPSAAPEPDAIGGSSLPIVVVVGLAIVVGAAGIIALLARGRRTKKR
jgi:plastocyanin